jgi:tetratricopeptide (TPR) repeat protein
LQRGLAAALRGDRQYQELLDAVPPDAADDMLLALRADALWSVGRTAEARQVLDGVLQRAPQLTEALLISARLDFENGLLDRAAEQLQQLVSRDPHHVVARYQLALVQRQLGRMDQFQETMRLKEESQALIDRLVELNKQVIEQPGDAALCLEIADVCDQLGKRGLAATWRKAAAALQQASINAAAPSR